MIRDKARNAPLPSALCRLPSADRRLPSSFDTSTLEQVFSGAKHRRFGLGRSDHTGFQHQHGNRLVVGVVRHVHHAPLVDPAKQTSGSAYSSAVPVFWCGVEQH